jgi:hypothetical protein
MDDGTRQFGPQNAQINREKRQQMVSQPRLSPQKHFTEMALAPLEVL